MTFKCDTLGLLNLYCEVRDSELGKQISYNSQHIKREYFGADFNGGSKENFIWFTPKYKPIPESTVRYLASNEIYHFIADKI